MTYLLPLKMSDFHDIPIDVSADSIIETKKYMDDFTKRLEKQLFQGLCIPSHVLGEPMSLRSDYGYTNATAVNATTTHVTLESMSKAIDEFRRRCPIDKEHPDHIVMTNECFQALQEHCEQKAGMFGMESGQFGAMSHIYGIPVEHFPTEAECSKRAYELWREHGLKVMFVTQEPPPES